MTTQLLKDELIAARYGNQNAPEKIIWNAQIAGILNHRSVRSYLNKPLPDGWLETLVAAAQSASTSSNLQQWSVIAVTDPHTKAQVRTLAGGSDGLGNSYIDQAPAILLWLADISRNRHITLDAGLSPGVHEYLDAFLMASLDAALAAQNASLAAESIGLGTVYIGAVRNKAKELAELLHLPQYSYVVCGLVVGWPDPDIRTDIRPRLPQQVVLYHNRYEARELSGDIASYEEVFKTFRQGLGMQDKTWQEAVQGSSTDMTYMDGRQALRKTLDERGFGFK